MLNFGIISWLLLLIALSIVVALSRSRADSEKFLYFALSPERATVGIVGKKITIWWAIQERRSHEPMYKINTKNNGKRFRATTFDIEKLAEQ